MKCKKFLLTLTPFCFVGPLVLPGCSEKYISNHEYISQDETLQIPTNESLGKVNVTYNDLYMATSSMNKTYLVAQITYTSGIPDWDKPVDDNDYILNNSYSFSSIGSSLEPFLVIDTGPWNLTNNPNQNFEFDLYDVISPYEMPNRNKSYTKALNRDISKRYNGVDYLDFVISPKPTSYYYFFDYPYRWLEQSLEFSNIFSQGSNGRTKWGGYNFCNLLSIKSDKKPLITTLTFRWITSDINLNMKKLELDF